MEPLALLQLVADPQRWQILQLLTDSDLRVGELTDALGKAQNLTSYHLRELRDAGIVRSRRSSADGRDTYYRLVPERLAEVFELARAEFTPTPPRSSRLPKVLYLCTGNSARSQMAEAITHHRSGGTVKAVSAGSHPKPLHPEAVRVLAARGIDIAGQPTKSFDRFARSRFDRVITLCDKVREVCPEFPGDPQRAHWSMPDPSAADDTAAFERTADDIEARVDRLLAEISPNPNWRNTP